MSAGTLKLTNGSTAVTGTGTSFTTDLTTADFVVVTVGGTMHSLAVDSVTNATALVLSAPFTGPTTAVVAWQAVPRKTMLRVTAELNKQVTEALRLGNENAINWQAVLSSPDTVNVLLPDGTTLTGFSWRKINDLLNALDVDHLDATASQIHTDAQQVSTDKPIIVQAKTDAISAKTAAVNAKGDAETAKTASEAAQAKSETAQAASEASAVRAEAAAGTVDTSKFLRKDDNLASLADKAAGRLNLNLGRFLQQTTRTDMVSEDGGHILMVSNLGTWGCILNDENGTVVPLGVGFGGTGSTTAQGARNNLSLYSRAEIDARIGYALLTTATNIALSGRMVLTNPFGINTPVICLCELYHATLAQWVTTDWIWGGNNLTHGITANYKGGEGIILRAGQASFVAGSQASGSSGNFNDNYATPSPVRVHVWKVTS